MLAIGPEGGFTDNEVQAAEAMGWRVVTLGPARLRIETAAGCRLRSASGAVAETPISQEDSFEKGKDE